MSLPKPIDVILLDLKSDTASGATQLARKGLDALRALAAQWTDTRQTQSEQEELAEVVVNQIAALRPSIGAIGVSVRSALEAARRINQTGTSFQEALRIAVTREEATINTAGSKIAEAALDVMGPGGCVVTCSVSETVNEVMRAIHPDTIRLGAGHPLNDGVQAARYFSQNGFRVELYPDGALSSAVMGANAVIIGADQVLRDGSIVNRASSLLLALLAFQFKIPFFVVCGRNKFSEDVRVSIESADDPYCLDEIIETHVPLFDITPPGLITRVITD